MSTSLSWACSAFLVATTVACSSEPDPGDGDSPVAKSALEGTIAGKSFKAASAVARAGFDDDGTRSITIYEDVVTCADGFAGGESERMILTSAAWEDGFASAFSLQQNATLVPAAGENFVATQGRIEIVSAAAAGEKGTIRLRAYYDEDNQVEGEIEIEVCEDR